MARIQYTDKQLKAIKFIKEFIELNDHSPTINEIGEHLGVASVTAWGHLCALVKKGAISRRRGEFRSITIRDDEHKPDTSIETKVRRMADRDEEFRSFIVGLADELRT